VKRSFGQIVTIAFGTLAKLVESTRHMRAPGTRLLAWKGKRETIDAEIAECNKTFRKWQVEKFEVPGLDAERHMCVFQV
jgi:16S rRNA G527 N7-methylase RsmG